VVKEVIIMERWEHDAFLGYMVEEWEKGNVKKAINAISNDVIFNGYTEDEIVEKYGPLIGEEDARYIFGQLQ